ncbi:TlpA family protein disulfide reductase [Chitinophaga agrisoli]|nr:TlpA disulfide reductase family protein [Chitinophaga agrisoli]
MRTRLVTIGLLLFGALYFCACSPSSAGTKLSEMKVIGNPEAILYGVGGILYYKRDHLRLAEDLTAYDTAANEISKEQFLKTLSSGKYLPLRLHTADSSNAYLLYRVPDSTDISLIHTLGQIGEEYYGEYKREGQKLPAFNFRDINGKLYTNETMLGKTVFLKCWFVHCWACVQEMPRLNQLVSKYSNRDDVLFLSLAFDTETELRAFLKKKTFNYQVASVPQRYMEDTLQVGLYPTHVIVNKEGRIAKVVTSVDELERVLPKVIH